MRNKTHEQHLKQQYMCKRAKAHFKTRWTYISYICFSALWSVSFISAESWFLRFIAVDLIVTREWMHMFWSRAQGVRAQNVLHVIWYISDLLHGSVSPHKPNSPTASPCKRLISCLCRLATTAAQETAADSSKRKKEKTVNCTHKWQTVPCCTYK